MHRAVFVFVLIILSSSLSHAQKTEEWLPITQEEWQIKDAPGNPVVQAGDGGQAVLRPLETASADKKD